MSQTKAQLVAPVGILTVSGITATGVITATSFIGDGSGLSNTGIASTANINTSGIITASAFVGDGSALTNTGIGTDGSVNTSGIITASAFVGDGSQITNPGGTINVVSFQPPNGATNVGFGTTVVITFDRYLQAGVGTVYIREGSPTGTIFEQFTVGTSSSITFNAGQLIIDPTTDLGVGTTYYVVVDAGAVKDVVGISSNTLIDTYSFTTRNITYPLFAWGSNSIGRLGTNETIPYSSPVQIPGNQWSSISGGQYYSLGTKTDGTLWGWGTNGSGQLGQNNRTQYSSPVQIPGNSWSSAESSTNHSVATKTDGTLWAWGSNNDGQLGQNNTTQYSSPVQIPGNQWSTVANGYYNPIATKSDGTLWAWGFNYNGQLGQNNRTPYSSPRQIPGTQWSTQNYKMGWTLSQGFAAMKTDGTLWSWGGNAFGALGLNDATSTSRSSPVQIPGTQWNYISNANSSNGGALATKTDGTLWAWGLNQGGALAQNNLANYSSPRQIPGTQWNLVSCNYFSMSTKTDGTLWVWGSNSYGQLGQNDRTSYSSPVQIPGTLWTLVDNGNQHSLAIKTE